MDWRTANTSENILCDMTDAPSILVKRYQGFIEAEEKHYFMVNMNGRDAQFSIQIDDANEQISRSWRYDPACLEERNRVQTQPVRNSPDIGIGSLFDFVFGAGIQGLAAVTGTTSADLLSPPSNADLFCHTIDDGGRYACLNQPYSTENQDARDILLGQCFGLSNSANAGGLREVYVGVNAQSCYGLKNSDHAFACTTCNGSRKWAAVYATGTILTCYP
ncbi:MAG: hypothetical protein P8Q50_13715 [Octadecabacter sp.]|nr:hypothetical protein [Octadecabacter sp.]